jgi:hypothetical protein
VTGTVISAGMLATDGGLLFTGRLNGEFIALDQVRTRTDQNRVAEIPGASLNFVKADRPTVTTKGRALDHIGFDVKNLEAFLNNLQANGIKLDRPYTKTPFVALAFIYDPWGTYIELNERPAYQ